MTREQKYILENIGWSWSKLQAIEKCQYLFCLQFIDKIPSPQIFPAMNIGSIIHDICDILTKRVVTSFAQKQSWDISSEDIEKLIQEKAGSLAENDKRFLRKTLGTFRSTFGLVDNSIIHSEFQLAFTKDYRIVHWFSKRAFMRVKIDRLDLIPIFEEDRNQIGLVMIDYKAGNSYIGVEQLKLYAAALKRVMPFPIFLATGRIQHLYSGDVEQEVFSYTELTEYWESFLEKVRKFVSLDEFIPNPTLENCSKCQYNIICKFAVKNELSIA